MGLDCEYRIIKSVSQDNPIDEYIKNHCQRPTKRQFVVDYYDNDIKVFDTDIITRLKQHPQYSYDNLRADMTRALTNNPDDICSLNSYYIKTIFDIYPYECCVAMEKEILNKIYYKIK